MSYLTNAGWDATYTPDEEYVDEDVARDEDNYGRAGRCTCGRLGAMEDWHRDAGPFPHEAFDGCSGCDPVDWECKPYGFGIESFEDAHRCRCRHACQVMLALGRMNEAGMAHEMRLACATYSALRAEASRLVWDRICDEAASHRQAVERYKAWARRAAAFRFRDDLFPE